MALLHNAELRPSKLELLAAWLPTRSWYRGPADMGLKRVSACRFDDPAGEVGVETMLVDAGDGVVLHTPLTYRGAPLEGGDRWLVGTTEHSVLGSRWVYDACGDPVYLQELARCIVTGVGQAEEFLEVDGQPRRRDLVMRLQGGNGSSAEVPTVDAVVSAEDGDPAIIVTDAVELVVVRTLGAAAQQPMALTATWDGGGAEPVMLAYAKRA